MHRTLILTKDGSHTISVPAMNVTYHSLHGAIQESMHVFIQPGLDIIMQQEGIEKVRIFEMGFGTGLNALLTFLRAEEKKIAVHYTTIDLFPLESSHAKALNFTHQLNREDTQPVFESLHDAAWENEIIISPFFKLFKSAASLLDFKPINDVDLIYFDAFAPAAQPELWTKEIFEKLYSMLVPGGLLLTYCSKGDVRRAMQAAGFTVEKIPGPLGKREIVRARKVRSTKYEVRSA